MANSRMLRPNICTSDKFGTISDFEEVLYLRMLLLTDSWGCLKYGVGYIKDCCFPNKNNSHRNNKITEQRIKTGIENLIKSGLIISFQYDGMNFLLYSKFSDFQELKSDRLGISCVTGKKETLKANILDIIGWDGTGTETERKRGHEVEVEVEDKVYIDFEKFPEIKLTSEEYEKLKMEFPNDYETRIEKLWLYIGSTGKKYKSHYLTILSWSKKEVKPAPNYQKSIKDREDIQAWIKTGSF